MRRAGTTISRVERRADLADWGSRPRDTAPRRMCGCPRPGGGGGADTGRVAGRRDDGHSVRGDCRPRSRCVVRRGGTAPTADHERQVPGGARHRDRSARGAFGPPLRGDGPMGVSRSFGVRTGPGQEVEDQSVDGLRADAVPSGPGVGLLPDPERSGSRAGPFPPRHPSDRRRALEDPVVARRRQLLLPSQFVRSPRGRRRPCVRGTRVGWGLVRLRRGPPDGGPPRCLVASSPHPGVQSHARAHRGPARVAGCGDAEGDGLRRLWRGHLHHHQHDALSAKRRRPALGYPSLGPGLPSATGRAAQQRAPGHHVPQP